MSSLSSAINLADLAALAQRAIEPTAWDYYRSGAWDETTLARSEAAWRELEIHYRGMVDVSQRSGRSELFGRAFPCPLMAAPTAMQRMAHPEGECATARACSAAGLPMCLSSLSTTALEEVRAATTAPLWMQVYISQDRGFTRSLVERADAAGIEAFAVTADTPVWGIRERDMRNGFRVPDGLRIVNLERPGGPTGHTGVGIGGALSWTIDATLTWSDVEQLASWTTRPIIVKGLCRPDDVRAAFDAGARGVWISNHGGRQLDGAPATADVLAPCAAAARGRGPVVVDGGIRRGTDILRAVALGADAVAVGRPILWGLGAGGEEGVARALAMLRAEFELAMALAGVRTTDEIRALGADLVRRRT
jgi:isopentenyl diphosphate isomerase/L-lactate dehydrogenase-like FMN-dependent dehydrogenase